MSASHFRELNVWQDAMLLAQQIYTLTRSFPAQERFGLCSQMQRAAVSIPSNIAEGNARRSRRDYARFVSLASGSAAELQTQLLLSRDLGLVDAGSIDECLNVCERVSKMLYRLQQSLANPHRDTRSPVPGPRSPSASSDPRFLAVDPEHRRS